MSNALTLIFPLSGICRCFLSLNWLQFVLPSCARRDEITSYINISIKKKRKTWEDLKPNNVETKRGNVASLLKEDSTV